MPLIQAGYELTDQEKMDLLRLSNDRGILAAIGKMMLIREQSAMESMIEALETDNNPGALRWAGYRRGLEEFTLALKEVTLPLKERINAGTEPAS